MKRWLWSVLLLLVVVIASVGALLNTTSGLKLAAGFLPASVAIEYEGLDGSLLSGVAADRLTIVFDGGRVEIDRLSTVWNLEISGPTLTVANLDAARIGFSIQDTLQETEPGAPPPLPLGLVVESATIGQFSLMRSGEAGISREQLRLQGHWRDQRIRVAHLGWQGADPGQLSAELDFGSGQFRLQGAWQPAPASPPWSLLATGSAMRGDLSLSNPAEGVEVSGTIRWPVAWPLIWPELQPEFDLDVTLDDPERGLAGSLAIAGNIAAWTVSGEIDAADQHIAISNAHFSLNPEAVSLAAADIAGSLPTAWTARLSGSYRLEQALFDLSADWQAASYGSMGTLVWSGQPQDWRARLGGDFQLPGGPSGRISIAAQGDDGRLSFETESATIAGAQVTAAGELAFQDLVWEARAFATGLDPARLDPRWSGRLGARLGASGTAGDVDLDIESVDGELLGAPLQASGQLGLRNGRVIRLAAQASSGDNQLEFDAPEGLSGAFTARAKVQDLGHFLPGASGRLDGEIGGAGGWPLGTLESQMELSDLSLGLWSLGQASIDLERVDGEEDRWQGTIDAQRLAGPGQSWENVRVALNGDLDRVQFQLEQSGSLGQVVAAGSVGASWLKLTGLLYRSDSLGEWQLDSPLALERGPEGPSITEQACLVSGPAQLCVDATGGTNAELHWRDVPMELLSPAAGVLLERPVTLSGLSSGRATADWSTQPVDLDTEMTGDMLIIEFNDEDDSTLQLDSWQIRLNGGDVVDIEMAAQGGQGASSLGLDGQISGLFGQQPPHLDLTARIAIDRIERLAVSQERSIASGSAKGQLRLQGPADDFNLSGQLSLANFSMSLLQIGSDVEDGNLQIELDRSNRLDVNGSARLGNGEVTITGQGVWENNGLNGEVRFQADQAQLANLPELKIKADVDLTMSLLPELIRVGGEVRILEGKAMLGPTGDTAVRPSPDVVYIDERPSDEVDPLTLPVRASVRLFLAKPVQLTGFGIDANVTGGLNIEEIPGEITLASGSLNAEGTLRYQGRQMDISEGQVVFSRSPLDNPELRIAATTDVAEATVGVRVGGTARTPSFELFSDPPMSETEILSSLLLGRSATQLDSSNAWSAALAGLRASGAVETRQLAGTEVNVDADESGPRLSLGRFLSPRLYVSYTIGLIDQLDQFSLSYRLNKHWALHTELGLEARAAIKYRVESGRPARDEKPAQDP